MQTAVERKRARRSATSRRKRWLTNRGMQSNAFNERQTRYLYRLGVEAARRRLEKERAEKLARDREYLKEGPLKGRPGFIRRIFNRVTARITGRR
jgi:hypothetical protein